MPTPTTYTYSLSLDAPGGAINSDRLTTAIRAASGITIALDSISTDAGANTFSIAFRDVLPAADRAVLDGGTGAGGTNGSPSGVHPAGGLIASTSNAPNTPVTQPVEVTNQPRMRDDGVIYAVPKPSGFGLVMCDRDIRINACIVDPAAALEDLKVNTQNNKEEPWGEMSLVGVFKDSAGTMVACANQAEADLSGILSAWDYTAKSGGVPISYEIRDGLIYVDSSLPALETWTHRAYAVVAPQIPAAAGGSIALFDGYLGANPDNVLAVLSPQATVLDPAGPAGPAGAILRLYVFHPAGSKLSHVLRLVAYRAPGTF
jgi:hypothetical protein